MKTKTAEFLIVMVLGIFWMAPVTWAHVSANVKLLSTKETVLRLLPDGKFSVRKVELNANQLKKLRSLDNWNTRVGHFNFFISREDGSGRFQRAMVSMVEFTRHGPLVVAVALDPQGKITGAILTDTQVEPLTWLEPLLKKNYMQTFIGKDSRMPLTLDAKWKTDFSRISQDFARVLNNAVKKGAQLFDVVFEPGSAR